jgi:hypothetical protein
MLRTIATATEVLDNTVSTLVHGIDILHINPDVFCIDELRRCMSDESSVFLRGKGASRLFASTLLAAARRDLASTRARVDSSSDSSAAAARS